MKPKSRNHHEKNTLLILTLSLILQKLLKKYQKSLGNSRNIEELLNLLEKNPITNPQNKALVTKARKQITIAWNNGVDYAPGENTLSPEGSQEHTKRLDYYLTKLGLDLQKHTAYTLLTGITASIAFPLILKKVTSLGVFSGRLDAIAVTEVMNTFNTGSVLQAKENGIEYFIVEYYSDACDECIDTYADKKFIVGEDEDVLPPLHPNCRCYPVFLTKDGVE
jgi:hypothetical protein